MPFPVAAGRDAHCHDLVHPTASQDFDARFRSRAIARSGSVTRSASHRASNPPSEDHRRIASRPVGIILLWAAGSVDTPEAAFERYRTEINGLDFDRLAKDVIAADALLVFTDKRHRGLDEVRAAFNAT